MNANSNSSSIDAYVCVKRINEIWNMQCEQNVPVVQGFGYKISCRYDKRVSGKMHVGKWKKNCSTHFVASLLGGTRTESLPCSTYRQRFMQKFNGVKFHRCSRYMYTSDSMQTNIVQLLKIHVRMHCYWGYMSKVFLPYFLHEILFVSEVYFYHFTKTTYCVGSHFFIRLNKCNCLASFARSFIYRMLQKAFIKRFYRHKFIFNSTNCERRNTASRSLCRTKI